MVTKLNLKLKQLTDKVSTGLNGIIVFIIPILNFLPGQYQLP